VSGKGKSVLGDNPFGELPDRPSRPPRGRPKRSAPEKVEEEGDLAGRLSEAQKQVQALLAEAHTALERGEITDPEQREKYRAAMVDFAGQMQDQLTVVQMAEGADRGVLEMLRRFLRPSYYLKRVNRFFVAGRGVEVDRFGMDPVFEKSLAPALDFMYDRYWRIHAEGLENVPVGGGCLVVANHAPVAGFDGLMLRWAVSSRRGRPCRWLMEDELYYAPYIGQFCQRLGGVRASRENAVKLLEKGVAVVTFPEGNRGIRRLYRDRYELERFGRGGFVRIAIRQRVPVVPVAIVGPEESAALLARINVASRSLSMPFIPITPTFPLLGPLGVLPLPRRWVMRFGAPVTFDEKSEAAEDQALVSRLGNEVRSQIQGMLDDMLGRDENR
jgi:1-acyl-sn-glycerol-3-phosphate acyltransferase